eukprot:8521672-Heterocapsa_arctica.AAC.1
MRTRFTVGTCAVSTNKKDGLGPRWAAGGQGARAQAERETVEQGFAPAYPSRQAQLCGLLK